MNKKLIVTSSLFFLASFQAPVVFSEDAAMSSEAAEVMAEQSSSSLADLKSLVAAEAYADAYDAGQELLFDHEGDPEFDLLYGTAALETGHAREAIFTFERLSTEDPANSRYKLELGRAYYQIGEGEKARALFQSVLVEEGLPKQVVAQVVAYLQAIDDRTAFGDPGKQETLKGFIGVAAGSNSNVNSASSTTDDFGYLINGDFVAEAAGFDEESASFLAHKLGAVYSKPLGKTVNLDFTGMGNNRNYSGDSGAYDIGTTLVDMALRKKFSGGGTGKINVRYTGVKFAHEDLNNSSTLGFSWGMPLKDAVIDSYSVNFSTGATKYETLDEYDIDTVKLGLSVNKQQNKFLHAGSFLYGTDSTSGTRDIDDDGIAEDAEWNSRGYFGLNYALSYFYGPKTKLTGGLLYLSSSYDEVHGFHQNPGGVSAKRDGTLTALSLSGLYVVSKNLQINANFTSADNGSDLNYYDNSRNTLELGAVYQL